MELDKFVEQLDARRAREYAQNTIDAGNGYRIVINKRAGCGRAYRATVMHDGHWIGVTGACTSEARALEAAQRLLPGGA